MLVIIIGGGRTGTQLATLLLNQNHHVHIIENRREILNRMHRELPTEIIYEGPCIVQAIVRGLAERLHASGDANLTEAVAQARKQHAN